VQRSHGHSAAMHDETGRRSGPNPSELHPMCSDRRRAWRAERSSGVQRQPRWPQTAVCIARATRRCYRRLDGGAPSRGDDATDRWSEGARDPPVSPSPSAAARRGPSLPSACAIGSHPSNDLVLDDGTVSRFHCELTVAGNAVRVRDLGSRNGTSRTRSSSRTRWFRAARAGVSATPRSGSMSTPSHAELARPIARRSAR